MDPIWLTVADVVELHRRGVALTGESVNLRSPELLESAVNAPVNAFVYEQIGICEAAALYASRISANQPFENGNKRAGWLAMRAFLTINGWGLAYDEDEAEQHMNGLAEHTITESDFVKWVCVHAQ